MFIKLTRDAAQNLPANVYVPIAFDSSSGVGSWVESDGQVTIPESGTYHLDAGLGVENFQDGGLLTTKFRVVGGGIIFEHGLSRAMCSKNGGYTLSAHPGERFVALEAGDVVSLVVENDSSADKMTSTALYKRPWMSITKVP